jgi:hypothetical protein
MRFCQSAVLISAVLSLAAAASPKWDTSSWIGAEYTPSSASNELWWWNFDQYEQEVDREMGMIKRVMGFTTLRMFLHSMLFEADPTGLINNMTRFLSLAQVG